jgi:serine/threonine protein kinase
MPTPTSSSTNWMSFAESPYPWERDALDFVRERFPSHEPWRAWSLFEFLALDGSVNEVDLLVYAPFGFFLVEIKSRPGRVTGDAGTWTWETDGRLRSTDNPLKLVNFKAKKLAELLNHQSAAKRGGRVPFIEPLVFLSAPDLKCDLADTARLRVCLRDRDAADGRSPHPGILAALRSRDCPGLDRLPGRAQLDRPTGKIVARAIEQAGIRQSNRQRKVSDYLLEQQIDEGNGYQDWQAGHVLLPDTKRRIRIYPIRTDASEEKRRTHERAAIREFQLIETLQNASILRAVQCTGHELGPAVIFEHDPASIRLDHFLQQRDRDLTLSTRIDLVRQLAEVMAYAHKKRVVHRALSPRSILVVDADSARPRLKVFNWQAGYRAALTSAGGGSAGSSAAVTATSHVGHLVDDPTTAYMAPDILLAGDTLGEHLDVFSLGAVAYHILSGRPPAADGVELANTIRTGRGLQLAAVLDGACPGLCELIQFATHPDVSSRFESVADFLENLDQAEDDLTSPVEDYADNPAEAVAGDLLPGGLKVERRIGQGSCSSALLVSRPLPGSDTAREELILKIALLPDHADRLRAESATLRALSQDRDPRIVAFVEEVTIGDHAGFLMRPVFTDADNKRIETLAGRIRKEGRFHIELLERLGEDLIDVVRHLEKQGIAHRDIKPDNIAVGRVGRDHTLQIVLFDFSLAAVPQENIRAGTIGYLDPLLPLRRSPPRFDSYAERYAVAATLHEMATGSLPKWGDGRSDPSLIDAEATVDADLFDTDLREPLARFFTRAFRRDIALRFDNAEQMLAEWKACFASLRATPITADVESDEELARILAPATLQTPIPALGLGTRATNALDRANILTVRDLLASNRARFERMRGVGAKTRREITAAFRLLRDRLLPPGTDLPEPESSPSTQKPRTTDPGTDTTVDEPPVDPATLSIDAIADRLLGSGPRGAPGVAGGANAAGEGARRVLELVLGRQGAIADEWPTQTAMAAEASITRARVSQLVGKLLAKAVKEPAITAVRTELLEVVEVQGGVATAGELADSLLAARGSDLPPATAHRTALGIIRIALEAEGTLADPRLSLRRDGDTMLAFLAPELADYAIRLGRAADRLATEEPLASPGQVIERLRTVVPPAGTALPDPRLVRLAAAASHSAALSSRLELYPRGMESLRALKLSLGAVSGAKELTEAQLRERVASRYPLAQPLPPRPALDGELRAAGLPFTFDPAAAAGQGAFVAPLVDRPSVTSGSTILARHPTALSAGEATGSAAVPSAAARSAVLSRTDPEFADARAFEDRLTRALQNGSFLQLVVDPRFYERTADELCHRFGVQRIDVEEIVIAALRETAAALDVDWNLVVVTDADRSSPDWQNLRLLVERARPLIAARLVAPGATTLLVYADILVRFELKGLLADLQQQIGTKTGPHGVWLLVPGSHAILLDGQPVGVPGQQGIVSEAWLQNLHRAARTLAATP